MNPLHMDAYDNIDVKFDAVLKTLGGEVIETGRGQFDAASRSVNFESDFIPLYRLGTRLEIVRMHDGVEVHRFEGEVYLSSSNMLRLVSVDSEILPEAALVFLYYVNLEGTVQAPLKVNKHFLFFKRPVMRMAEFPVKVHALSVREVKFNTDLAIELDPGLQLTLAAGGELGIASIPLEVRKSLVFGQEANCYQCRILPMPPEEKLRLDEYVRGLSLAMVRRSL